MYDTASNSSENAVQVVKKKNKKKSIEAPEFHMQEISEGLMKQGLVDKEQLGADMCT